MDECKRIADSGRSLSICLMICVRIRGDFGQSWPLAGLYFSTLSEETSTSSVLVYTINWREDRKILSLGEGVAHL